ncbi:hypothetical protein [Natronorarus salvus]|uniref:hypothetical protein n=1 Tax=Natronorarus salvus TaxID=3117733 RepID=UPI002F26B2CE
MLSGVLAVVALSAVVIGLTLLVHRDSARIGMDRPERWAAIVFATTGLGVTLILLTPIPPAAVAVLAIVGPVIYLFEREDAVHGDGSADGFALPMDDEEVDGGTGEEAPEDG